MNVLLTRPALENERIASQFENRGVQTLVWPLTKIVALARTCPIPRGVRALLATSANGIRCFARLSINRELPVFAVGDRTASVARVLGFTEVQSAGGDATALAEMVSDLPYKTFLHPRGRETAVDLNAILGPGKQIIDTVLYGMDPAGPPDVEVNQALVDGRIGVITIWSARNAEILRAHLDDHPDWQIAKTDIVAISERAAEPLRGLGFRRCLGVETPDADAIVETSVTALRQ